MPMSTFKHKILTLLLLLCFSSLPLSAKNDHNLTDAQLNAFLGIITNFILSDEAAPVSPDVQDITHNGTTYGFVTSPYTGKVWLDRNLGAARVCEQFDDSACYGDYYQWGRNFDGHEDSMSATIATEATDVNTAGSDFITGNSDWASVDASGATRATNWSKTDGSSVCPVGYRVPSITELRAETLDNGVTNRDTAFANFLKLPSAGDRINFNGSIHDVGYWGYVWSSSASGSGASYLFFDSDDAYWLSYPRPDGLSVRCLRD